jgi:hypothetical protein
MGIKQHILFLFFLLIDTVVLAQEMKCIENTCIPKTDIIDGQPVFQVADKMPVYPGGIEAMFKHIAKNIRLHGSTNKLGGKMLITFILDITGHVRNVCIVKSCFEESVYYIEQEISDVFRQLAVMQPWEYKGRKVPARFYLPIAF